MYINYNSNHSANFLKVFAAIFSIILLSGCDPVRKAPTIEIPDNFTASGEEQVQDRWWEEFSDPNLNELIEAGLTDNLDVLSAWDRYAQAEAIETAAKSSFWPNITGTLGASDMETMADEKITMTPYGPVSNKDNDGTMYSASITASYELDLWGRVRASRKASHADFEASAQDLQTMTMTMSGELAKTWYQLVEQRKKIEILEQQKETNKSYLEIITLMYEQGLSPAADVLQQKQQVSATQGELLGAKMLHELTEQRFAVLMGKHPTTKYYFEEEYIPELPPLPETGVPSGLILKRPDVKSARLRLEAADYRVYEAIANQFPQISLSASASDTDDRFRSLFDSWVKNLAANMMMPIFNGGLLRSQVKLSRATASGQLHAFEKTVLMAITEVESALTQERIQKEMVENFDQQLEISRQALEFTKIRYQNGATSYIPVLINLTTVQRLERMQIEAQRTQITYRISLYRALGGGFETERPKQDKVTFKAGVKK